MATFSRDTIYAPLRTARLYNLLQELVGGSRDRADFVRTHVTFRPDEKVVDAGFGTGGALEFLPLVNYFGFDPNPDYIRVARSRYGRRGEFWCGDASSPRVQELAQRADAFLSLGGVPSRPPTNRLAKYWAWHGPVCVPVVVSFFTSLCFSANDDWLGRMFMRLDRGGNIKSDQALRALVSEYFAAVEEYIRQPVYLFRYTIQALIARNPRAES
jgi:hypothetical protein